MIVVGVDPGARETGIAVVEVERLAAGPPELVTSFTVKRAPDRFAIEAVPRSYLDALLAAVLDVVLSHGAETIAVEGVTRPTGFSKGRKQPIDPGPLLGTAVVLGAILGRGWTVPGRAQSVPVVRIPPMGNGRLFPLTRYPEPLATSGKGGDKRRHERSAYDVAVMSDSIARADRLAGSRLDP